MKAVIDGATLTGRAELHALLAEALCFPAWYGANLDALYDCLTELGQDADITVRNTAALHAGLGRYADALLRVLRSAAAANWHLHLRVEAD